MRCSSLLFYAVTVIFGGATIISCGGEEASDGAEPVHSDVVSDVIGDAAIELDSGLFGDVNANKDARVSADTTSVKDSDSKSDVASAEIVDTLDALDVAADQRTEPDGLLDSVEAPSDVAVDSTSPEVAPLSDIDSDADGGDVIILPAPLAEGYTVAGVIMEFILGAQATPDFPQTELYTVRWEEAIDLTMSQTEFASLADGAPYIARVRSALLVTEPGVYDLAVAVRGGVQVRLHDQVIIEEWSGSGLSTYVVEAQLEAGYYPIEILYNRTEPKAHLQWWWGNGAALQVVGSSNFALSAAVPSGIPDLSVGLELVKTGYGNVQVGLDTTVPVQGTITAIAEASEPFTFPLEPFTVDGSTTFLALPADIIWSVSAELSDPWGRTASVSPIEMVTLSIPSYTAGGLMGTYYQGGDYQNFETAVATRIDPLINHPTILDGNTGGSFLIPMNPDQFAVQWFGGLYVPETDIYVLHYGTDDGQRLWVDGEMLAEAWYGHGILYVSATLMLAEGWHPLQLDWYESGGAGGANLEWESSTIPRQIIPTEYLGYVAPESPTAAPVVTVFTATYEANNTVRVEVRTEALSTCKLTVTQGDVVSEIVPPGPANAFLWPVTMLSSGVASISAELTNDAGVTTQVVTVELP
jgi:hypothetical protein